MLKKVITLCSLLTTSHLWADVKLPAIFGDSMVLQRDRTIPVWGWADPGEKVTVQLGDQAPKETQANQKGEWKVELPPLTPGGPLELSIKGNNGLVFKDILIGDVWLCSGQSNMEWTVNNSLNPDEEKAKGNHPKIRHIKVPLKPSSVPESDFSSKWTVASPDTVGNYTAAGYFMAIKLQEELDVPIGLINSSWGGTRIEPWTPPEGFASVPALKDIHTQVVTKQPNSPQYKAGVAAYLQQVKTWQEAAQKALENGQHVSASPAFPDALKPYTNHQEPTTLYNAMLHPLKGFPLRGAIWYQGESNHGEGKLYTEKTKALVQGWREVWGDPDLPFYYVQIAPFRYGNEDPFILPVFWEAQEAALEIPNTGIVNTMDIAHLDDIHPKNKQEVGRRLALQALKHTYGKKDIVASGPKYKSFETKGDALHLQFEFAESGLKTRDGKAPDWFEIAGDTGIFEKADARIEGSSVILTSPKVQNPSAVRFGWNKIAEPNLINKEGLPAYPFRAGQIKTPDVLPSIDQAKDFKVLYDLDLHDLSATPKYSINHADQFKNGISKMAWLLELRQPDGKLQWCYISADPLDQDLKKLGVPVASTGAVFQNRLQNAFVLSNLDHLPKGDVADALFVEFWSHNYAAQNHTGIPGASDQNYDFGDQRVDPVDGYGSMQIHHVPTKTTLFAINNFKSGQNADLGIGNSSGKEPDWTFAQNANQYPHKRLRVLVLPK